MRDKTNATHKACGHSYEQRSGYTVVSMAKCIGHHRWIKSRDQHDSDGSGKAGQMDARGGANNTGSIHHDCALSLSLSLALRPVSFSPHIAFKIASINAKPTPSTHAKYHIFTAPLPK